MWHPCKGTSEFLDRCEAAGEILGNQVMSAACDAVNHACGDSPPPEPWETEIEIPQASPSREWNWGF